MDPHSKKNKICRDRFNLLHMSHSALHAVSVMARKGELPEIQNRKEINEAINAPCQRLTPYGPVLTTVKLQGVSGSMADLEISNPLALIWAAAQTKYFSKLLLETQSVRPSSPHKPWSLVLYADEGKVGAKMKFDNRRNMWNVFVSFVDFGAHALAKEEFWLPLAVARVLDLEEISGGISQVFKELLKMMFGSTGFHLGHSGVFVELKGVQFSIYAVLGIVLGDEAALHSIWLCKGSSGTKACIECMNALGRDADMSQYVTDEDVMQPYNKLLHIGKCKRHSAETIYQITDELATTKATQTNAMFLERQTRLGFTWNNDSLLADVFLRNARLVDPSKQNMYDWSHNVLQGVFQKALLVHSDQDSGAKRTGMGWGPARSHDGHPNVSQWMALALQNWRFETWHHRGFQCQADCERQRGQNYQVLPVGGSQHPYRHCPLVTQNFLNHHTRSCCFWSRGHAGSCSCQVFYPTVHIDLSPLGRPQAENQGEYCQGCNT